MAVVRSPHFRSAAFVLDILVGTSLKQQLANGLVPVSCSCDQGRHSSIVELVYVGVVRQNELCSVSVAVPGGENERCVAKIVAFVDVGASIDAFCQLRDVAGSGCCENRAKLVRLRDTTESATTRTVPYPGCDERGHVWKSFVYGLLFIAFA